jgi:hypothetical protein
MYGRKVDPDSIVTWPLRKSIHIDIMLGLLTMEQGTFIVGYTEEANAIVMKLNCGDKDYAICMVQLDWMDGVQETRG